ncbi:LPS export ABC transporter ATP-binding protein [Nitrosococcus oceani]|uniref:Lipopolysaccharide export system ATP-binding protein LptB n=2 Tax=Nitrosococcus oceani TaxID=1229 RepID=Q3J7F7_NITOC|nr:LPS export ABC transporter ATP-binding protein [Nitrosococcus oceani]KFI18267.1 sugar ABC transporter ATP-binding protein [Nitrosococcus oceani C-27]ABA59239.1 ABC transporter, ATPase subunit [Nitrosococcus oceani ATCC 19707]EDZ65572.1 ABC transporter, ATP-binding protein, putative [Nitrosococcus oceani AFC27]KFI21445.1 sugar ABC transporter ATP-binding protein [Nitrosococcus oceani]GEM21064.1 ABC transporter ATP-binding protein [Nitrosococcus oceani]
MSRLSAYHLAKCYQSRWVVKDVSLEISSSQIVGILGPNGAGKTTCFYMLVGLISADRGLISLDHRDITHYPIHRRARLGISYLPQEASVFRKLTVAENIMAIVETRRNLTKPDRKCLVSQLLRELNITHIKNTLGMSLSGGERRRVEIARALAVEPQFILLDEPFAGVDPISVLDIQGIIRHLAERGIGVLITDHNVRETLGICQYAYIVNEGEVIAKGKPQEILDNEQVKEVYLGYNFYL